MRTARYHRPQDDGDEWWFLPRDRYYYGELLDEARGREAEDRFLRITRSLRNSFSWITAVSRAGKRLDNTGVDIIVHLKPYHSGEVIKVPVQIKSSKSGVCKFWRVHDDLRDSGILVFVINDECSDADIALRLLVKLDDVIVEKQNFNKLIKQLKAENVRLRRKVRINQQREKKNGRVVRRMRPSLQ